MDLRFRLNSFGARSLQRILGYYWSDFLSIEHLLRETQMRFITCIVPEHLLWLYGHVAHFPDADPAQQILSARESLVSGGGQTGRQRALWLQQVDQHQKNKPHVHRAIADYTGNKCHLSISQQMLIGHKV